jgi:hypothetical protein
MAQFTIEVSGQWADSVGDWRPAVSGTLNQSEFTDEVASTFGSRDSAMGFFESCIQPDLDDDPRCAETPRFRLRSGDICESIG